MKKQNQKGITLIALIITIIVMLILVAVTVNVAINGGLFNAAKDGARKTQLEADKEVLQAGIIPSIDTNTLTIPNAQTLEDNLPEGWKVIETAEGPYTATSPKENKFTVTRNGEITEETGEEVVAIHDYYKEGDTIKCRKHAEETYTIGQAYNYTPKTVTVPVEISGADSGVERAIEKGELTANDYGENGKQEITQENLSWVVLGVDEKDTNKLLITTSKPTDNQIALYGAEAYDNGIDIINNICAQLYSSEKELARGMTLEDVNSCLGFTKPEGKSGFYVPNDDVPCWGYGNALEFDCSKDTRDLPNMVTASYNKGLKVIPGGNRATLEETLSVLRNIPIDGYYYEYDYREGTFWDPQPCLVLSNVPSCSLELLFGRNGDFSYLLSTRVVVLECYGPRYTLTGVYRHEWFDLIRVGYCNSGGWCSYSDYEDPVESCLRPVVSLVPEI